MGRGAIFRGRVQRSEGFDAMENTIPAPGAGVNEITLLLPRQGPPVAGQSVARSAEQQLRADWPDTWACLTSTYFDRAQFGRTRIAPSPPGSAKPLTRYNDAGYMLRGLQCFYERANAQYGHLAPTRQRIDSAAAREVRYQFGRQRQARDIRCYLVKCWLNLLVERPERIWPERYGERR